MAPIFHVSVFAHVHMINFVELKSAAKLMIMLQFEIWMFKVFFGIWKYLNDAMLRALCKVISCCHHWHWGWWCGWNLHVQQSIIHFIVNGKHLYIPSLVERISVAVFSCFHSFPCLFSNSKSTFSSWNLFSVCLLFSGDLSSINRLMAEYSIL